MKLEELAKQFDKEKLKQLLVSDSDDHVKLSEEDRKRFKNYKSGVYDFILKLEDLQKKIDNINSLCEKIK